MKLQAFIDQKRQELLKRKKRMKRKAFVLKAKIFLTCVLPVVILLLAVKVIQTLIRVNVRKAAVNAAAKIEGNKKKEVVQVAQKPEFVTPSPVDNA